MNAIKSLHIRLTTRCNMRCAHCYAAGWQSRYPDIESRYFIAAIEEAQELNCTEVTLTGGEPLVYSEVEAVLQFIYSQGLKLKLETNGLAVEGFFPWLEKFGDRAHVCISLDGEKIRGKKQHEAVKQILKQMHQAALGPTIQTMVTHDNAGELHSLLEYANDLSFEQRLFVGHCNAGRGTTLHHFTIQQVFDLLERLRAYEKVRPELPPLISGRTSSGCGWGISRCEIMPNGDVTSCATICYNTKEFTAGNIRDRPLTDIWLYSEHFKKLRELTQSDFDGACKTCAYWENCRGSCRAVALFNSGEFTSAYPLCDMLMQAQQVAS